LARLGKRVPVYLKECWTAYPTHSVPNYLFGLTFPLRLFSFTRKERLLRRAIKYPRPFLTTKERQQFHLSREQMKALLNRPYWSRTWIAQELVLSRKVSGKTELYRPLSLLTLQGGTALWKLPSGSRQFCVLRPPSTARWMVSP
jgi:hypothetical protein